jgi:hypothetical protein
MRITHDNTLWKYLLLLVEVVLVDALVGAEVLVV